MELLQKVWWEEGKSLNISISGLYGPRKTYNDISSNDLYQIIVESGIIGGVAIKGGEVGRGWKNSVGGFLVLIC